VQIWQ